MLPNSQDEEDCCVLLFSQIERVCSGRCCVFVPATGSRTISTCSVCMVCAQGAGPARDLVVLPNLPLHPCQRSWCGDTGVTCPIGLRARLTRVNGARPVDPCPIDRPHVPIDRGKPPNASPVVPRGNRQACSPLPCLWGTAC